MSKTKATAAARKPTVQEKAVSLPASPASGAGFKTHWQGGNPFDRMNYAPKVEKANRR
ncbi:hypothetical protein [Comamonas serinivorans]|uniref:hypothetical protein n=1 Tax=Comamonas serinivorans TaxID=1082851 RepID=UPI0012FAAAC9|nr:hypothetical protein [Comamonas serinivorans]